MRIWKSASDAEFEKAHQRAIWISEVDYRFGFNPSGWCAARALPFFQEEAKRRQARKPKDLLGPIGPDKIEHRARDDAAKAFDTSPRNVERGKLVLDKEPGPPQLWICNRYKCGAGPPQLWIPTPVECGTEIRTFKF
jgi:hypothetical protein